MAGESEGKFSRERVRGRFGRERVRGGGQGESEGRGTGRE